MSDLEWDLWSDQKAQTSTYNSWSISRILFTQELGIYQGPNHNMSDSISDSAAVSSGEVIITASTQGIYLLVTGLSSAQASLLNISLLLSSRLGAGGTDTLETSMSRLHATLVELPSSIPALLG